MCIIVGNFHSPKNSGENFHKGQVVQTFPWKVSVKSESGSIRKMQTIQQKISEISDEHQME